MGSSVSRSGRALPSAAEPEPAAAPTAKVVDLDGSMAQFSSPVTAREALAATRRPSPPRFLCCSDELDFDAPVRALAARDALQAGQLYFVLPVSMLGRPLPAQDMAALAVKACAALGAAARDYRKRGAAAATASDKQRQRRTATGRVSPFVVVSAHADGQWKSHHAHGGGRTVGKARQAAGGYYRGVTPRLAPVQRLNAIVEAASEEGSGVEL